MAQLQASTVAGTLTTTGNVGIGTNNTSARLRVNNSSTQYLLYDSNGNFELYTPESQTGYVRLGAAYSLNGVYGSNGFNYVVEPAFNHTFRAQGTALMTITGGGNVGIGVTGPEYLLDLGTLNEENSEDKIRFNASNGPAGGGGGAGAATGGGNTPGSGIIWKPNYTGYTKRSAGILQIAEGNYFRSGLAFYVNNVTDNTTDWSEALRISSNSNVGIGITAPSARLDIASIAGSNDEKLQRWTYYAPTPQSYFLDLKQTVTSGVVRYNFSMVNADTAYNNVLVLDRGNVGIGTTNPVGKLDVRAGSGRIIFGSYDANYYAAFEGGDQLNFYNGASNAVAYINYNGPSAVLLGRNLYVEGNSSGGATGAVRIKSDGNIGINTTSPGAKLDVYNGTSRFWHGSTTHYTQFDNSNEINTYTSAGALSTMYLNFRTGGDVNIARNAIIAQNAGNVGIGNTNPTAKLQVDGRIFLNGNQLEIYRSNNTINDSSAHIRLNNNSGQTLIYFTTSDVQKGSIRVDSSGNFVLNSASNTFYFNNDFGSSAISFVNVGTTFMTANGSTTTFPGNVGIGTASPAYKLDVNGTGRFTGNIIANEGSATEITVYNSSSIRAKMSMTGNEGDLTLYGSSANATVYLSAYYDSYFIGNGGTAKVGIGTASPEAKLHIHGANPTLLVKGTSNTDDVTLALNANAYYFNIINEGSGGNIKYESDDGQSQVFRTDNATGSPLDRFVIGNGNTANVYFTNANVGIGITSPGAKLHVSYAGTDSSGVRLVGGGGTTAGNMLLSKITEYSDLSPINLFWADHSNTGRDNNLVRIHSNETGTSSLPLRVTAQGTLASPTYEALAVNYAGNVGIGTTSPSEKLHVVGSSAIQIIQSTTGGANSTLKFTTTARTWGIGANMALSNSNFEIYDYSASANRLTIDSAGNVGIGLTNPRAKLEVSGDIYQSWADADRFIGQVYVDGTGYRNGILTNSATRTTQIEARSAGADGEITFLVGTSEVARMVHGGNVGIGTDNPTSPLRIQGGGAMTGGWNRNTTLAATYPVLILNSNNSKWAGIGYDYSNDSLRIWTNGSSDDVSGTGTQRIVIVGGKVGIGTGDPIGGNLHLYSSVGIFEGPTSGKNIIDSSVYGIQVGPVHNRDATANYYYPGVAFNHLLNYNGTTTYNVAPQAWVGLRLYDTPGSERSNLVFATKEGTGTSGAGTDIPTERMCIDPFGKVGIGLTSVNAVLDVSYKDGATNIVRVSSAANAYRWRIDQFFDMFMTNPSSVDTAGIYNSGSAFFTGNVGVGATNRDATLHIDSGATGATAYALRTDAASLDYALYVSSSGNVAVGGLVPAAQLNHKFVVFSGSIALRGPNEAAYSYRLNDTGGTNRNALYVSSSNYLNVGNASFAGLELFHTGSFDTRYQPTIGFEETRIYGNQEDNYLLGLPDNWLAVRVAGKNYAIPMYDLTPP